METSSLEKPQARTVLRYPSTDTLRRRQQHNRGHVSIADLSIRFGQDANAHIAVQNFNLTIEPGEFVCLLGPSGCGKSTVMNALAGFIKASQGNVQLDGKTVEKPGPDRGMVFQQHSLLPWKTVLENVAFGPLMTGATKSQAESLARTFLEVVGLSAYAERFPNTLSGGMQQRVGIARALANYPSVLLMDEPFGALDAQTRHMMQENLLEIWSEFRNTVLFVTHDIDEAVYLADRVIVMSAAPGRLIEDIRIDLPRPRTEDVYSDPAFISIKQRCLKLIRDETMKAFAQQNQV
jgi:NitT/TauT family transport system ATP-binding protein